MNVPPTNLIGMAVHISHLFSAVISFQLCSLFFLHRVHLSHCHCH